MRSRARSQRNYWASPCRGTSLIENTHPPGPPQVPRHSATVGSYGGVSCERGTQVRQTRPTTQPVNTKAQHQPFIIERLLKPPTPTIEVCNSLSIMFIFQHSFHSVL